MADIRENPAITISDKPVTSDAPAWMLNRLDGSHYEALNTDVKDLVWNVDRQEFALLQDDAKPDKIAIYKEAEAQKKAFSKNVDSYNVEARKYGSLEMDIYADHTWDEVLAVQQGLSQEREVEILKGFKGFWQKNIRRFGHNSDSFKPWLSLLPTESHYLSVLCGGLTLVLGAARRMSEIRESIRNVIEGIPSTLSKVKDYVEVLEDFPAVHKCSADLYVAILSTLDIVVREYQKQVARLTSNDLGLITSAIFKQSMSGKDLQERIKMIEVVGGRLAVQAKISFMERQKLMLEGEKDITKLIISSRTRQNLGFKTIACQNNGISDILKSQERKLESQDKKLQSIPNVPNGCIILLTASPTHRTGLTLV